MSQNNDALSQSDAKVQKSAQVYSGLPPEYGILSEFLSHTVHYQPVTTQRQNLKVATLLERSTGSQTTVIRDLTVWPDSS